jgi:hypothetical protein
MRASERRLPRVALAGLLLALCGCGGKRLYPVEGVVVFEGGAPAEGLKGGTVSLESVADGSNAAGQIGPGGAFRIQDPLGRDGAPAGTYRVLVLPSEGSDRRRPPIGPRYMRYDTSGIEITVKPEKNTVTVTVARPAGPPR